MVLVIQAHPYPDRSRANKTLGQAIEGLAGVEVRSLYDLYPDFAIDVKAEQQALARSTTVVWQHPIYWYAAPALLKLWFEHVLTTGWAHGEGGDALAGKRCLWVVTTGADAGSYAPAGAHKNEFDVFVPVIRQTARYCGMVWQDPIVVYGAHEISAAELDGYAADYRRRVEALCAQEIGRG